MGGVVKAVGGAVDAVTNLAGSVSEAVSGIIPGPIAEVLNSPLGQVLMNGLAPGSPQLLAALSGGGIGGLPPGVINFPGVGSLLS